MPRVNFECDLCEFKTKKYIGGWRKHLMEDSHQMRTRVRSKSYKESEKQRCCVIFGIRGLQRKDVLKFFSERNVVTDFVFWKECPDICIVEFLTKQFCDIIAAETKSILGNEVVFRMRHEISDIEWRAICPLYALKEEGDGDLKDNSTREDEESDDDDCIVIENPCVKVKTEVVDVDLDIQDKAPTPPRTVSSSNEKNNNSQEDVKPNVAALGITSNSNENSTPVPLPAATKLSNGIQNHSVAGAAASLNVKREGHRLNNDKEDEDSAQVPPKKPRTNGLSPVQSNNSQKIQNSDSCHSGFATNNNDNLTPPNRLEPGRSNKTNMRQQAGSSNQVHQAPQPPLLNNNTPSTSKKSKPQTVNSHHLALIPTPKFITQVNNGIRDNQIKITLFEKIYTSWTSVVQEFNLLVWENIFGIELYKMPPDIDDMPGLKDGFKQDGPLIRGILISDDKIEKLAQLSSSRMNPNAEVVKSQKENIMALLTTRIQPRPLKHFDETAQNLSKRSNARLTFKLQVCRQNRPPPKDKDFLKAKPTCMLTFANIITTDTSLFKRIVIMYHDLWKEYSLHRIKMKSGFYYTS